MRKFIFILAGLFAAVSSLHAASWLPLSRIPAPSSYLDFAGGYYLNGSSSVAVSTLTSTSRASTGYAANADGTLTNFATNTPRIGIGAGLLIEEARTNLALQSQDLTTSWTMVAATPTSNTALAPDATLTADTLTTSAAVVQHSANTATINFTSAAIYTYSQYFKNGTNNFVQLTYGSGAFSGAGYANFDLTNGTVSGSGGTLVGSGIQALNNGWYRCWITATATSSSATTGSFSVITNAGSIRISAGPASVTVFAWGGQVELGAFPTSYIPTTTASVTRALDNISMTGGLLNAFKQARGTVIVRTSQFQAARNAALLGVDSAAAALQFTSGNVVKTTWGGGALSTGDTATLTGANKVGIKWNPSGRSIVLNGGTVATDATVPSVPTVGFLGVLSDGTLAADGLLSRLTAFNSDIPDAQFQLLTQ